MKLKEILNEFEADIIGWWEEGSSRRDKVIVKAISQIRKEVIELVKKSHGWFDFIKNLDKFCEEE